jgi:DNA repair exonuclease SbcCD ATPase subunit
MNHDVTQWLQEIQDLQQQIADKQRLIEEAHSGADRWRELYNKEAQQRRHEAKQAQQTIEALKAENQRLKEGSPVVVEIQQTGPDSALEQMADQLLAALTSGSGGPHTMRAKLLQLIKQQKAALEEVARLNEALEIEKTAHANTRQSLTNALADAVEQFKAHRATLTGTSKPASAGDQKTTSAYPVLPKNPSLELPPLNQDQPPL